jgi:hydrophobic/amphiphilic exporter-1 (mainly G- bacteria), HAE1 family
LFYVITRFAYGKEKLAELNKNYKPDPGHGDPVK